MAKILRLTKFTMAKPDGTRVPRTTVNWIDDEGKTRFSTFEGHLSSSEAEYQVGAVY